jgi:hypothetical protein
MQLEEFVVLVLVEGQASSEQVEDDGYVGAARC